MKKIAFILLISLMVADAFAQKKAKKSKKEAKNQTEVSTNEKILLRYNLKQGEGYEQTMDNDTKTQIMGMDVPSLQKISTKTIVTQVDDAGNLTQETTIEKFYMKQSNPMMGDMEYDSEDPKKQEPALAAQLGSMKGTKTITKISPNGKMLENSKDVGNIGTSNQYPEKAVGVGDTWEVSSSMKNPMLGNKEIINQSSYKLLQRNAGKAILELNGKITSEGKEIGSISGKITVDEKTGIVLESDLSQQMTIEIQGMEAKIDSKIKMTSKKL